MTNENIDALLSEGTWRRISAEVMRAQLEARAAIDRVHDDLRQRLQVVALDSATPEDEENGG